MRASPLKPQSTKDFHCPFHYELWDFKKSSILGPSFFPVKYILLGKNIQQKLGFKNKLLQKITMFFWKTPKKLLNLKCS
jgi:hypothetical protein